MVRGWIEFLCESVFLNTSVDSMIHSIIIGHLRWTQFFPKIGQEELKGWLTG